MKWLGSVVTVLVVTWLTGVLNRFVPPPERAWLALKNLWRNLQHPEDSFRVVLCWLENDTSGNDARSVNDAFTNVEGIKLIRSARMVTASGAADEWRPAMQQRAFAVLADWNADVAIVGTVKKSGEVLSLWFVPRLGDGTLDRGDKPYKLENVTLGADFHEDLRAQLSATAMAAVAPLADTEARGRVLDKGLQDAAEKLSNLLKGATIGRSEHGASLHVTLGNVLLVLGEREAGTERLEQSADAYRAALGEYTRERVPLSWGMTQNNLGNVLMHLGERQAGTEHLEQAVDAYRAALKERTRERVPLSWATTQNNLGNVLMYLGERETGTERFEQAVDAYEVALKERTRERVPLGWAMTQNNLGNVLMRLGERETGTECLEQAVGAYEAALQVHTRERAPLSWATTQNNLGSVLGILGERETGTERFEQAVDAYEAALKERTRERVPLDWAATQTNLGNALALLGEREAETERLEQAVGAYEAALEVFGADGAPRYRDMTERNLHRVLKKLQESQS